ncbi:hypothetical protein JCM21900_004604 [Sporobolomyces salmonicolor]
MGKVRHRKRTRAARIDAANAPLAGPSDAAATASNGAASLIGTEGDGDKKAAKKDQEFTSLLDKLRSAESRDRVWASSTLSSLLITLPPMHLRLLLSRNLIGLLIERLALPVPTSTPASAPDADDLTTAVESLGALRNLAVSSPPHILSEMHNKRLLLPLLSSHLPLLLLYLPPQLAPAPAPLKPNLPATAADRKSVELANEAAETLRRVYWDWAENVLVLLWCFAESNTKILGSLNAQGDRIVELVMAFLMEERVGIEGALAEEEGGMDVDKGAKGKKGKKEKDAQTGSRVPLYVAVAAAQTLHAFVSSNPPSHPQLLASPDSSSFSPSLSSLLSILLTPAAPASKSADAPEYWTQLRVLAFGILLELAKGRSKRRDVEKVREVLRENEARDVLLGLVEERKLDKWVEEGGKAASEIDPTAPPTPVPAPNSPLSRLSSLERQAQTLQLALEILSEYLASPLSSSSSAGPEMNHDEEESEEEWGGISMDVEEGAIEMDEDDEAMGDEGEAIVRDAVPGEDGDEVDGDEMLDDLEAIAGSSDDEAEEPAANGSSKTSLPLQLLALTTPTSLSFLPATSFSSATDDADPSAPGLISTSATSSSPLLPASLSALSDALTTIHVHAVEALNNLFVSLAKGKKGKKGGKELQEVFERVLELMHASLSAAEEAAKTKEGKIGKQKTGEEEQDELEEHRAELVSAGAGVVWGCARLGLADGGSLVRHLLVLLSSSRWQVLTRLVESPQIVGPSTTPFLIQQVYNSPFAAAQTPQGEALRVRMLGALGWIGRRRDVPVEENAQIGQFLLSLLPSPPARSAAPAPAPAASALTHDALLQVIDSFIDLYADEERDYDTPVFREGGMLPVLEASVAGVRAAIKKIDRKKFPELRGRADGALENLVAFVAYRKDVAKAQGRK